MVISCGLLNILLSIITSQAVREHGGRRQPAVPGENREGRLWVAQHHGSGKMVPLVNALALLLDSP